MLTVQENEAVLAALQAWAKSTPDEPVIGFLGGDERLTPQQVVTHVRTKTSHGRAMLEMLEHGIRREGVERVVTRFFRRPPQATRS